MDAQKVVNYLRTNREVTRFINQKDWDGVYNYLIGNEVINPDEAGELTRLLYDANICKIKDLNFNRNIPAFAFYNNKELKEYKMNPNTVRVGRCAFAGSGLEIADLPRDAGRQTPEMRVGYGVYSSNPDVEDAPPRIAIEVGAYKDSAIKEINYNRSKKYMFSPFAFYGCNNLEKIILYGNVDVGSRCFYNCKSLKHIAFWPDFGPESWGENVFGNTANGCLLTITGDWLKNNQKNYEQAVKMFGKNCRIRKVLIENGSQKLHWDMANKFVKLLNKACWGDENSLAIEIGWRK